MNKDRFDFLEIDVAILAAEKMQQEDRTAVVLENNCKVVGILNEKVEKLENRLAEACPHRTRLSLPFIRQAG